MNYSIFIPESRLQRFVECFWLVQGDGIEEQIVVPDGCSELIFHLSDPFSSLSGDGQWVRQEKILIAGQIAQAMNLRSGSKSCVLGVKFKPDGLWSLLRIPMGSFTNNVIDASNVLRDEISCLRDRLLEQPSSFQKVKCLEQFLLGIAARTEPKETLGELILRIENAQGSLSIHQLAREFRMSERKLQRTFLEQVGVSAKMFTRIVRFRNVYQLLQKGKHTKAEASYLLGYFDQPHFNNEFREFTGMSPEDWFRANQPMSELFMGKRFER